MCCGGCVVVVCCGVLWCVAVVCCGMLLWCVVVCCCGVLLWCVAVAVVAVAVVAVAVVAVAVVAVVAVVVVAVAVVVVVSVTYERARISTSPQDELANPLEPSSTHRCERSKARKTGAQLRHSRRSAKNDAKCVKKPIIATKNAEYVIPGCAAQLNVHINRR